VLARLGNERPGFFLEHHMYYVYGHYKKDTGELFYIGKGTKKRAWLKRRKNPHWSNVVNKHGLEVRILEDFLTEEQAFQREKELIEEIGLENLTNLTEGGQGGCQHPEHKKKISEGLKRWRENASNEWNTTLNKKVSEGMKRRWKNVTAEERANLNKKISEGNKRKWENATTEERKRHGEHSKQFWKNLTPEQREVRCSLARERNQKLRGRKLSPEVRLKMSMGRKNAARKAQRSPCPDCGKMVYACTLVQWHFGGKCLERAARTRSQKRS
jgi:DNA polymerase III gamma/tau subunit